MGGSPLLPDGCGLVDPGLTAVGRDPVPDWQPPWESAEVDPELAARYPLQSDSARA